MATNYSFTQPIRYYKANDPYYYEVDNIPLRQLEENILYVKGLIETNGSSGSSNSGGNTTGGSTTGGYLTAQSELDINNIKQLKPKAGGGRTISVNAGRFVSRVNDAFDISKPLNTLVFAGGVAPTGTRVLPDITQLWDTTKRDAVWDAFTGTTGASNAYNINGLEFTYTFYSTPGNLGQSWGTTIPTDSLGMFPRYAGVPTQATKKWPGFSKIGSLTPQPIGGTFDIGNAYSAANLPSIHLAFVQMWRGVFRTSVVDFPNATIEVPVWSDDDFYTVDEDGNHTQLDADQRIDLLVAYSLPIDSSSTTLPDYSTDFCTGSTPQPKVITQPTLGIIRGAGVGLKKDDNSNPAAINALDTCVDPLGRGQARIIGNKSDKSTTANLGIKRINGNVVHGSFPSPDDLLNIAPVVALGVETDAFQLIGQAALPLAYVVVTKGQNTITANDIIDIRPFLRTTEFTYNERAGIAAANPPLSLANPAVGAFQLQNALNATLEVASQNSGGAPAEVNGRALYTDYVMGGLAYGVEGTLLTMCDSPSQASDDPWGATTQGAAYTNPYDGSSFNFAAYTSSKNYLEDQDLYKREAFLQYVYANRQTDLKRWLSDPNTSIQNNTAGTYLGLPEGNTGRNIPLFPEWDMPMDGNNYLALMGQTADPSVSIPKVTWWMWFEANEPNRSFAYVPGGVVSKKPNSTANHLDKGYEFGAGGQDGEGFINVCSKKLEITFPTWVNDYDVLVEYVNCGPVTATTTFTAGSTLQVGLGSGISVNKGPVISYASGAKKAVFQINSASQSLPETINSGDGILDDKKSGPHASPVETNERGYQWLSYAVALPQFRSERWGTEQQTVPQTNTMRFVPKFGASYYPTIKFTIIGYKAPTPEQNTAYNQAGNNFTLIQGVAAGNSGQLTNVLGPLTDTTSKIDIESIT